MWTAINNAQECGVHSVEHGNWLDDVTAQQMAGAGTFLVPTLVSCSIAGFVQPAALLRL